MDHHRQRRVSEAGAAGPAGEDGHETTCGILYLRYSFCRPLHAKVT